MKYMIKATLFALAACVGIGAASGLAHAEDIDIFLGTSAGSSGNPNVLIVLDNTSNWSRQSQQWPGGAAQGQSEVNAIRQVITSMDDSINIGLMEFVTGGNANDDGGFIRSAIKPMTADNKTAFSTQLTTIYNNITSPDEKRNSNTPYGNLMYDVYNYFAGANTYSPTGAVLASLADSGGYTTNYSRFRSPLSAATSCSRTYVIFIGNPNASGPSSDSSANTAALAALGGSTTQLSLPNLTTASTTTSTVVGTTSQCYASKASCSAAEYASQCSSYSDGCTCGDPVASTAAASCPAGTQAYSVIKSIATTTTTQSAGSTTTTGASSSSCYKNLNAAKNGIQGTGTDHGGLSCPASSSYGNTVTTYACSYSVDSPTSTSATGCSVNSNKYRLTQTAVATVYTTTDNTPTTSTLGYTAQCYASAASCSTSDYTASCTGTGTSCACGTPTRTATESCAAGTSKYEIKGTDTTTTLVPASTWSQDTGPRNADEWAAFLASKGIPVTEDAKQIVTTYTIDVYNKQPNATQTALLWNMAKKGGGKYFAAKDEQAIVDALKSILVDIKAVNSTFASTSLPVSATNRSQNENQVFIGMFRPDSDAKPRWFGNMKRYLLKKGTGGNIELADVNLLSAINNETGFVTDCAQSYWTFDSGTYWASRGIYPDPSGTCATVPTGRSPYSDAPDGPAVEKGAIAEILRQGNNPSGTATTTWSAANRKMLTVAADTAAGDTLPDFDTTTSGLSSTIVDFVRGKDIDEAGTVASASTRISVHGDVIHSRPLPVNYGGTDSVVVYYGANDGTFRAVQASSGKENWALVAPEFYSRLSRQMSNSPLMSYPGMNDLGITPAPQSKDYFFDGSTGIYQNVATASTPSKVWIYPTMRRGGRMLYALDVTSSEATPKFKWKAGCPNLDNDTGCTTGMTAIGQTWSVPNVAFIRGYTDGPVIVMGGGYHSCEDADEASPACASRKGNVVYVLDASNGTVLRSFATEGSVAGDVSLVDIDGDAKPDYAFAADTKGNIYRVSFIDGPTTRTALVKRDWVMHKVAFTTGGGRKFLFGPALLASQGYVYVALGSGDREHPLETDYPYEDVVNRFYVVKNDLSSTTEQNLDALSNVTENNSCEAPRATPTSDVNGWFMNLNQTGTSATDTGKGEQTVTSALIVGGMVAFSTNRPTPSSNSCTTQLGKAYGYLVNLLNGSGAIGVPGTCGGLRFSEFVGGGLPPSPVLANGVEVDGESVTVVLGAAQKDGGKSVTIAPQKMPPTINSRRKRVYTSISGN
jgi:hypothetical protein